jgi:hypothetical protein
VSSTDPKLTARLLRCAQAARYLGASAKRIRALILSGELPYIQLSEHANSPFLIDVRDLDRLIEARKTRV